MKKSLFLSNFPNIISAFALFFSWIAIIYLLFNKFYISYGLIYFALMFDSLDGYFARKLSLENNFGKALDGYIDVINYLIYPALSFVIFFKLSGFFQIISIFIFIACGIYRLARFEVRGIKLSKGNMYYEGFPVFVAPFIILLFLSIRQVLSYFVFSGICAFVLLIVSVLMVATFRFPKPRNVFPLLFLILVLGFYFIYKGL